MRNKKTVMSVGAEHLKLHATELVKVLMTLKKTVPGLKSDTLWVAIRKNWYVHDLERALKEAKRGRVGLFKKLVVAGVLRVDQAGKDGCFCADGYVWGTKTALGNKLGIGRRTLEPRIEQSKDLANRSGLDKLRRKAQFYRLDQVRELCADFLSAKKANIKARKDGFASSDGHEWGTLWALQSRLSLDRSSILGRIVRSDIESKSGIDGSGKIADFYRLDQVEQACSELINAKDHADGDGFFEAEGLIWGTVTALSKNLKVSYPGLNKRIIASRLTSRNGRDSRSLPVSFYRLDQAKEVCFDLLRAKDQVDETGFVRIAGGSWGTIRAIGRKLVISKNTVLRRVQSYRPKTRDGRDILGRPTKLYSLVEVERLCKDLFKKRMTKVKA